MGISHLFKAPAATTPKAPAVETTESAGSLS
jgi:hypothetical protein